MTTRPGNGGPGRRPRISREYIEGDRRRRYADATAQILHECGRGGLTVTKVVRLSRSSRSSFYEVFGGIEDCLAHAFALAEAELFAGLEDGSGDGNWITEVRRAIGRFYGVVVARPLIAESFLIHSSAAQTDTGQAAFWSGGEHFVALLRRGRREAEALGRRPAPALAEECLSRAIISLAARRVWRRDMAELPAEADLMTLLAGTFYLGRKASEESLSGPVAA